MKKISMRHDLGLIILLSAMLFPLRAVGQFSQQGPELKGTGAVSPGNPFEGASVSLSADGNTAIVGGPDDGEDGDDAGAVWIWTRSGGVWTQQGPKLVGDRVANGFNDARQGVSVALSADGNTAIVGGPDDDTILDGINVFGAVWVWTRSGGVWTQIGPPFFGIDGILDSSGCRQGSSVALSSDGNTAIVGGPATNSGAGRAWIFGTVVGGAFDPTFIELGNLFGSDAVGPDQIQLGTSVSIAGDGNTVIAGGPGDNGGVGAAWVFTRDGGGVWSQQGLKLVGTGAVGTSTQGSSVSLSADGNTAIVGGSGDNNSIGAAWVFTRSGGVWTQQGPKLVASDEFGGGGAGNSVSISADGNTAIVGGPLDHDGDGASWIWTRNKGIWTQLGAKLIGSNGDGREGLSVSLSADGKTAIIGGPGIYAGLQGAWVFTAPSVIPQALVVGAPNAILGPGEGVSFDPTWFNNFASVTLTNPTFTGALTNFTDRTGFPASGLTYMIIGGNAIYPTLTPGASGICSSCYALEVGTFISSRPAVHLDAQVTETPTILGVEDAADAHIWAIHIGHSFTDIPSSYIFYPYIERLVHNDVSFGTGGGRYSPNQTTPRNQMAAFIARAAAGGDANVPLSGTISSATNPTVNGLYNCASGGVSLYDDVEPTDLFCRHIHYITNLNVTLGCNAQVPKPDYCQASTVSRSTMAIFLARAIMTPGGDISVPDANTGTGAFSSRSYDCTNGPPPFTDVVVGGFGCKQIGFIWTLGIVDGNGDGTFSPTANVSRAQMAKFIVNGFRLALYTR